MICEWHTSGTVIGKCSEKMSNQILIDMKTTLFTSLLSLLFVSSFAQDRTTVNAMSSEISDNLDLRAVASIFGDSKDLEDFEYRLNDPKNQISNLDLNNDNQVDYLRVVESIEGRTHIIVIQSVLGRDQFQDVATVEVERDSNNRVSVQVVGDVYMYGANYIYEPVYVHVPVIYNYFWVPTYRPYCSAWYWGYYPSFYYGWAPYPVFRYRNHISMCINFGHHYNYVNYRRCHTAYVNYSIRRGNAYERMYPSRSFTDRHSGYTNRYELDQTRNIRTVGTPHTETADNGVRNGNTAGTRGNENGTPVRNNTSSGTRNYGTIDNSAGANNGGTRGNETTAPVRNNTGGGTRSYGTIDNSAGANNGGTRGNETTAPVRNTTSGGTRSYSTPSSGTPTGGTRSYESTPVRNTSTGTRSYESPAPVRSTNSGSTRSYSESNSGNGSYSGGRSSGGYAAPQSSTRSYEGGGRSSGSSTGGSTSGSSRGGGGRR